MNKSQRYISDELTHFVGRHLSSESEQYRLLLKILKDGWLKYSPSAPTVRANGGSNLEVAIEKRVGV